jgi:hypothetical protein
VQALIADLTTSDQQTRQDLALIALNRSVGQHNGQLVSEIAERIYFDLSQRETEQQGIGRVAYGVLASRDPVRASHVRDSIEAEAATSRPQIVSPPNADSVRGTLARSPQAELIARIHPNVAYIQFAAESDRASADALRGALTSAGFWTPATEQLDGNFNNWIRFFHDADEPAARRAQEVVERYFRPWAGHCRTSSGMSVVPSWPWKEIAGMTLCAVAGLTQAFSQTTQSSKAIFPRKIFGYRLPLRNSQ